jgi:hypothetical protein
VNDAPKAEEEFAIVHPQEKIDASLIDRTVDHKMKRLRHGTIEAEINDRCFILRTYSDQANDRKPAADHCTGVCHFRRSRSVMFDVLEERKEARKNSQWNGQLASR